MRRRGKKGIRRDLLSEKKKRVHGENFKERRFFLVLLLARLFLFLFCQFPGLLFFFALLDLIVGHLDPFANVVIPAVTANKMLADNFFR